MHADCFGNTILRGEYHFKRLAKLVSSRRNVVGSSALWRHSPLVIPDQSVPADIILPRRWSLARSKPYNNSFTNPPVATKRSWKNRETGEYESQTTWHRCVVFGSQAAFAATLLKGAHVQIEGEIRTREYTERAAGKQDGAAKKSITEIRVFRITKLDRAAKSKEEGAAA